MTAAELAGVSCSCGAVNHPPVPEACRLCGEVFKTTTGTTGGDMKKIAFHQYLEIKAVNWSTLKEMRRSPLHYHHRLETPLEDSPRLAMGRAAHTAILEPDRFLLDYACYRGAIRRGKEWDKFEAMHADATILKLSEYQQCLAIRDAVRKNPLAQAYLGKGLSEVTVQWADKATGLPCKGRIDWVSESKPAIVDIKTTADVDSYRFAATAAKMGYHTQAAFYAHGYAQETGKQLPSVIIAVEVNPPYDVAVYQYDDDAIYAGAEEFRHLLGKVADCRLTEKWCGKYSDEQVLRLPPWLFGDDEDATGLDLVVNGQSTGV